MYFVKASDGVNIAVYDLNQRGRKTIFLIHGWPLSHLIFEYQLEMLLARDFRVVSIDLRGFGNSDVPAGGYAYDQLAEDIYRVVCALRLDRFILAGYSMGGAIALRYMREYQGYGVSKLILLSAAAPCFARREDFPLGLEREEVNEFIRQACADRPLLARQFSHELLFACKQSEEAMNWFEGIVLSASGIGTVQTAFSLRDEDGRRDLSCIRVPVAILHGRQDQVVPFCLAEYLHANLEQSDLYPLEGSGHGIMYDELETFNALFLNAVL